MPEPGAQALSAVPRSRALVGMGGNLGDVRACLLSALAGMARLPGTQVERVSSLYRSRPVEAAGPDYLNAVASLQTALSPLELLGALQGLEHAHDRERPYQNAPRTLDLDLLWHGGVCLDTARLTLPHPRMMQRAFVLWPLAEVQSAQAPVTQEGAMGSHAPWAACSGWPALPGEASRVRLAQAQGISLVGPLV